MAIESFSLLVEREFKY